jgi:hypothetical protein
LKIRYEAGKSLSGQHRGCRMSHYPLKRVVLELHR